MQVEPSFLMFVFANMIIRAATIVAAFMISNSLVPKRSGGSSATHLLVIMFPAMFRGFTGQRRGDQLSNVCVFPVGQVYAYTPYDIQ